MPRGALLPAVLLILLGIWQLDLGMLSGAAPGPARATVETVSPRSLSPVDGDTVRRGGQTIRLVGFDTPETFEPQCDAELALGNEATARLTELLARASSAELSYLPRRDQYGRELARLSLDGRDVSEVLIKEGLARRYSGEQRRSWC